MRRLFFLLLPLFVIVLLDQLTKWWALQTFWYASQAPPHIVVVPGWLVFTPVENRGVAFGLFREYGMLLALVVVALLLIIAVRSWRALLAAPPHIKVAIGVIAGGGIGNLIDRLQLSFVVDFITIPALPIFQVFNIADAAITLGGTALVIMVWRSDRAAQQHARQQPEHQVDLEETQVKTENH